MLTPNEVGLYNFVIQIGGFMEHKAFFALQRYGAQQARKKGVLTEKDVETLMLL